MNKIVALVRAQEQARCKQSKVCNRKKNILDMILPGFEGAQAYPVQKNLEIELEPLSLGLQSDHLKNLIVLLLFIL